MALVPIENGMTSAEFVSAVNGNVANYGDAITGVMLWPEILTKINSNYTALNTMFPTTIDTLSNGSGNYFKTKINSNDVNLGLFNIINAPYKFAENGSLLEFTMNMYHVAILRGGVYYIAYGANNNLYDNCIITYTIATKTWSSPVKVCDGNNDHGNPVILIDDQGYIHLFCDAHSSPIIYFKSNSAYDISAWTQQTSPGNGTYPCIIQTSDNKFYLFNRDALGNNIVYRTSSNRGATWSAEVVLTDFHDSGYYWGFRKDATDRIHGFGHECTDTSIKRYNEDYFYFDGTNWKNSTDATLTLPIDVEDIRIYDSATKYTGFPAIDFDSNNNPSFIFVESDIAGNSTNCLYKFAKKTSGTWTFVNIASCNDILQRSILDIKTELIMDAYLTRGGVGTGTPYNYGGFIERWTTADGGLNWSFVEVVYNKSLYGFLHPIENRDDLKFVFAEMPNTLNGNPYLEGTEVKIYAFGEFLKYELIGHQ